MIRCLSIIYCAWLCAASVMMAQQPAASAPTAAAKTAASVMTVTEQDNGKTIELTKGATLVVELSSNASTGYSWSVQSHSPALKLVKSDYQEKKQPSQLVGAPGVQMFRWQATRSGAATLQLEYRRPWEKSVPAAQVFSLTVQVR